MSHPINRNRRIQPQTTTPPKLFRWLAVAFFCISFILLAKLGIQQLSSAHDNTETLTLPTIDTLDADDVTPNILTPTPTTSAAPIPNTPTPNILTPATPIPPATPVSNPNPISREWRTLRVKPGDVFSALLLNANIRLADIQAILDLDLKKKYLQKISPKQRIKICVNQKNDLLIYTQELPNYEILSIERQADQSYKATVRKIPIETRTTFARGVIKHSFFTAGVKAGIDDTLIVKLSEIFSYDIDFSLDLRPNDSFNVLYEEQYIQGKKISSGPILAAEFKSRGKTYKAIRYTDKKGHTNYFNPNGQGVQSAFLRSPVNYTRISSHFNLQRRHPILHKIRAHKGVDYAAPRGTPVRSVGDGKIIFLGTRNGFGSTLIIDHGIQNKKKYTTLYAHLCRFAPKLKVGSKVKQGEVVGFVGSTGLATAPHLHYEFHVNGTHTNPVTVALPTIDIKGLQGLKTPQFLAHAKSMMKLMAHHEKHRNHNNHTHTAQND